MAEDRLESAQAPQPDAAQQETNHQSVESAKQVDVPANEVKDQLGLLQLAQQASQFTNLSNGIVEPDPDEHPLEGSTNIITAATVSDLQHLNDVNTGTASLPRGATDPSRTSENTGEVRNGGDAQAGIPFTDVAEPDDALGASYWNGDLNGDGSFDATQMNTAPSTPESEEHQIQAFAKLEFDDGEFYMNTYAVELGRDIHAAREAFERDLQAREGTDSTPRKRSDSHGRGSIASERVKQEDEGKPTGSIASESGGVVTDHNGLELGRKSRRKKYKSSTPSSHQLSRKSSMHLPAKKTDYNALARRSLMDPSNTNGFGLDSLMPSPDLTPLIPIHPPSLAEGGPIGHKSISRKHIRIAFNFEKHYFQVEIIGRNGCFVDDEWYATGVVQPLVNGSIIQIGGVGIRFVLPDVPVGETGAEMGMGTELLTAGFDPEYSSERESQEEDEEDTDDDDDSKDEAEEEPELVKTRKGGKNKAEPPPPPPVPKRKGPGRPPKNGIISKREQALIAKKAREEAKAAAERKAGKGKNSKDTKASKPDDTSLQPNGKRKYTKRKRAGGTEEQQGVRESTEKTDSIPPEQNYAATLPKPAKEKKPPKPPRSPSPVYDESTMTPEQLAKPQSSYVILIHEALSNSKTGQMSLPQIYRAIERRYPFYKLRVQTQGWQSSVRHNLSQHPAFRKIERDGKGWMWGLVPEISIEKEKKKRATPPPVSQQHYYQGPATMMQPPYPYHTMPPMSGQIPPVPYGMHPGMAPLPPYGRPGFPLPLAAQSESTYQSPYQSTPPPAATQPPPQAQQPSITNGVNAASGHYSTPASHTQAQQSEGIAGTVGPSSIASPSPYPQQDKPSNEHSGTLKENNNNLDVSQTITRFRSAFINTMDDKIMAEKLVTSAVNRTLGIQPVSTKECREQDPREADIMKALANMLGELSKKNMEAKNQSSNTINPPMKIQSTSTSDNSSSLETSAAAVAAQIAAKSALTNGDYVASDIQSGTKRPLENGDVGDSAQPEAKRVASGHGPVLN